MSAVVDVSSGFVATFGFALPRVGGCCQTWVAQSAQHREWWACAHEPAMWAFVDVGADLFLSL